MEFQEASHVLGVDNKLTQHFMDYVINELVGSNENIQLIEYILFIDFLNMTKTSVFDFTFVEKIIEKLNNNGSFVNFRPSLYYHVYLSLMNNYDLLGEVTFKNLNVVPYIYDISNEDHYDDHEYYLTGKLTTNQTLMTYINDNCFDNTNHQKYLSYITNLIKQNNTKRMRRFTLDIKLTDVLQFNDMIYLCKLLDFNEHFYELSYYNRKLTDDILYHIISNDMNYHTFITECEIKKIEITYRLLKVLIDKKILREFYDTVRHLEIIKPDSISYHNLDAKIIADQLLGLSDNDFMYLYECGFIKMISNNFSLQIIINNVKYSFTYIHKLNYLYNIENNVTPYGSLPNEVGLGPERSLRIKLLDERLPNFNNYPQEYIPWAEAYEINYYAYKVIGDLCSHETYIQKSRDCLDGYGVTYQGTIQNGKFEADPSGLFALVAFGAQDYYLTGQKPPRQQVAHKLYYEKEILN